MVERSDIILCYVIRNSGGAYRMQEYARKRDKMIAGINEQEQYKFGNLQNQINVL